VTGEAVAVVCLAVAVYVALRRQHRCFERDYQAAFTCTALVLRSHGWHREDPGHVWTRDETIHRFLERTPGMYLWTPHRFTVRDRLEAAWRIVAPDHGHHDGAGWQRRRLVVRTWLVLATGRVRGDHPYHCDGAWELGSWNARTWSGAEQTCWEADFASVCTGRAWHVHLYTEGGP
jgi:hypothetical protein